ncbi:phosphotransferase [Streptomyces sp. NPDC059690]|uniref:phosphotransferase n=1 Tax=Streptomyces sp. NPDC059690 TaxID=3346907 RepID=UPI0036775542
MSDEIHRLRRSLPEIGRGHHNDIHVCEVPPSLAAHLRVEPGTKVIVRFRKAGVLPVVARTWFDEAAIRRCLQWHQPDVPECLAEGEGFAIYEYAEGRPLSDHSENGKPVDAFQVEALTGRMAMTFQVKARELPRLPSAWPRPGDSQGFWLRQAGHAEWAIRKRHWAEFGALFTDLGMPPDALVRLCERPPVLRPRPFGLLHADLHRGNVIVPAPDSPGLVPIDWELATYGDPLHDLATHLVRMRYPDHQWDEVISVWATVFTTRIGPEAVAGLAEDLPHYLRLERAQSVFPDVMRAVDVLGSRSKVSDVDRAAESVRRALEAAQEPLRLPSVPRTSEITQILFRWWGGRPMAPSGLRTTRVGAVDWDPDHRFPERPEFPASAVGMALVAEGAAPDERIHRGTAHRNVLVSPAEFPFPVMVRRRSVQARPPEGAFLSERAVLLAIEAAGVQVAVPRLLAVGSTYPCDSFAIHTYVGHPDLDRPPEHPTQGLSPGEADALVDQLRALTGVDHRPLDPTADEGGFLARLCAELVAVTRHMPEGALRVAGALGLPDADVLAEILSGLRVTERAPVLLHGDLHRWNLVRRDDELLLTLIDWEKSRIGDPLYDLARHMYLARPEPSTRVRMFERWASGLDPRYTRDHLKDFDVYHGFETVRSAYLDLDREFSGVGVGTPYVKHALTSYKSTVRAALRVLSTWGDR